MCIMSRFFYILLPRIVPTLLNGFVALPKSILRWLLRKPEIFVLDSYFHETYERSGPPPIINKSYGGVWNQISIGSTTMQQAISQWWDAADSATGTTHWYEDTLWNATAVPPTGRGSIANGGASDNGEILARGVATHRLNESAPGVPLYTSRFFTNPTCRGYPWY